LSPDVGPIDTHPALVKPPAYRPREHFIEVPGSRMNGNACLWRHIDILKTLFQEGRLERVINAPSSVESHDVNEVMILQCRKTLPSFTSSQ
jgi:hypothetical protein